MTEGTVICGMVTVARCLEDVPDLQRTGNEEADAGKIYSAWLMLHGISACPAVRQRGGVAQKPENQKTTAARVQIVSNRLVLSLLLWGHGNRQNQPYFAGSQFS